MPQEGQFPFVLCEYRASQKFADQKSWSHPENALCWPWKPDSPKRGSHQCVRVQEQEFREHQKASSTINKILHTLEEVDEMDKYKNTLLLERFGMNDRIEDWSK